MAKIKGRTNDEKLNYLNSLPYSVRLIQIKGKFRLSIPELSLIAMNDNLETAYKDLYEKKQKLFRDMLECESEEDLVPPLHISRRNITFDQLKLFIAKGLIVCILIGCIFTLATAAIINKITAISWIEIARRAANAFVLEAEEFSTASDEVKKIRVEKFRKFLDGISPFANEFEALFSQPPREKETGGKE